MFYCKGTIFGHSLVIGGAPAGVSADLLPSEWLIAGPLALIVGIDMFPTCRCHLDHCEYSAELNSCNVRQRGLSSNEFGWLPYLGQKCAPEKGPDNGKVTCKLQRCTAPDFLGEHPEIEGINGIVGMVPPNDGTAAAIHNCLSVGGTRAGQFLLQGRLPLQGLGMLEGDTANTPENRAELFKHLGQLRSLPGSSV